MINGKIKKYEIKEKHHIYVETFAGKNHEHMRKLHIEFFREITKVQWNREQIPVC